MNIRELKQKQADLLTQAEAFVNEASEEKRELNDEERISYDAIMAQIEGLDGDVNRLETLEAHKVNAARSTGRIVAPEDPKIGMSDKDMRSYSVVRAIRAAASNNWKDAGLEMEASQAVAKQVGHEPRGFFLPYDVQAQPIEARDLTKGTPTGGGYLVATDLLAASFIVLLRNRMVTKQAGATILDGLVGDVNIPKQTSGASAYWVGEGGEPTESQQALGQLALAPKTVGAYTEYTRKLLLQSSLSVEAFVRSDLAAVIAVELDRVCFHGSGASNQPLGIDGTSGIGAVVGGANGAAPNWAHIVKLEEEVAVDNADVGRLAYISNPKVRSKLKQTMRTATYGDIPIWDPATGNNPLNSYPVFVTNQVSSTLTKGNQSLSSAIFFGNWADLVIGLWSSIDILVDPYSMSKSGGVRVVALQDADIGLRRPESFAAMLDALAA